MQNFQRFHARLRTFLGSMQRGTLTKTYSANNNLLLNCSHCF